MKELWWLWTFIPIALFIAVLSDRIRAGSWIWQSRRKEM
jgi:hypothetical protein